MRFVLLLVFFCSLFLTLITEEMNVYFTVFQQYREEEKHSVTLLPSMTLAILVSVLLLRLRLRAEWLRVESYTYRGLWPPLRM